jgi:transposase
MLKSRRQRESCARSVAKFADHLPLYRQSVIYARDGVFEEPCRPTSIKTVAGQKCPY